MLFKNTASQKIHVYAYDSTTGAAKTGDAANITGYVSLDGVANAIDDTNPAEVDATNMPGIYAFDLAQAETNCDAFALYAKSATANIRLEPIIGFTVPANLKSAIDNYSATRGLSGTALPAAAADAAGGLPISDAGGLDLDAKLANTNEVTAARMGALTDWINGGRLDLILDDILVDTGTTLDGRIPAALGANGNMKADLRDSVGVAVTSTGGIPDVRLASGITHGNTSTTIALGTLSAVTSITAGAMTISGAVTMTNASNDIRLGSTAYGAIADAVLDEDMTAHQTQGTAGQAIGDPGAAGLGILATVTHASYGNSTLAVEIGNIQAQIGTPAGVDLAADIAAIKSDTAATLTAVDTEVAAILAAVDTEIGSLQTSVNGLLTTALTESYRADGATGSVAQLLYEINQSISDRSISGTTQTVNKIDGTTPALTHTLNSSSAPTSITRAT